MKNNVYEKENFEKIVRESNNLTDIAKKIGLNPYCGNRRTIKKYIQLYCLDVSHFKVNYSKRISRSIPLETILVSGSTYNITNLKERLYKEGLKERKCEKCGQDENWHGEHMSLILDHINGINNDNRFENLRILCPNCNATLPTHCGKNRKTTIFERKKNINLCECGKVIENGSNMCSSCNSIKQRKVDRPSLEQLLNEVKELGYSGTGRKYGVSDNAIRKWIKIYVNNLNTPVV